MLSVPIRGGVWRLRTCVALPGINTAIGCVLKLQYKLLYDTPRILFVILYSKLRFRAEKNALNMIPGIILRIYQVRYTGIVQIYCCTYHTHVETPTNPTMTFRRTQTTSLPVRPPGAFCKHSFRLTRRNDLQKRRLRPMLWRIS